MKAVCAGNARLLQDLKAQPCTQRLHLEESVPFAHRHGVTCAKMFPESVVFYSKTVKATCAIPSSFAIKQIVARLCMRAWGNFKGACQCLWDMMLEKYTRDMAPLWLKEVSAQIERRSSFELS